MSDSSRTTHTARPRRASAASLHTAAGLQRSLAEFATASTALTQDAALAQKVIDAVHTGSSAEVERVLAEAGVTAVVTIESYDGRPPVASSGLGAAAAAALELPALASAAGAARTAGTVSKAATGQNPRTRTISVTLGIGPFSVSFSFKKESK